MTRFLLVAAGLIVTAAPLAAQPSHVGAAALRSGQQAHPTKAYWLSRDLSRLYRNVSTIRLR